MSFYAHCRSLSSKGDLEMDGTSWKAGSPMLEVAKRVLGTPRGRFVPDPAFGIDLSDVQVARSDAAARFGAALRAAFTRFTRSGAMRDFRVVSVEVAGDRLAYEISFIDPRAVERTPQRLRGRI